MYTESIWATNLTGLKLNHKGLSFLKLQGAPKRIRLGFCLISRQPSIGFLNSFFLLKLRSMSKYWKQNHFCVILGGWDIYKTKCGSETYQFIFKLSHSGLKTAKFAPSSTNWLKTSPDSSQVAPSGPSNPIWLFYLDHFQNLWELFFKFLKFWSESIKQESHFVLQISRPPTIAQKWFCIKNLRMELSFQEKKTI